MELEGMGIWSYGCMGIWIYGGVGYEIVSWSSIFQ